MEKAVRYILSRFPHQPTLMQQRACEEMVRFLYDTDPSSTFLLRGYAGTGKTSLVSALVRSAPALRIKTVLLAPTGRAAKVLSAYSGQPAYTIHRKIYQTVTDASGVMRMCRALNKHAYTLFVVDEASMIGNGDEGLTEHRSLLEDLVDYVGEGNHCRLMLIGDTAQLPPVGTSQSPALDIGYLSSILHLAVHHSELTEVVDVVRLQGEELEEVLNAEYRECGMEHVTIITRSNKRANMFNQAIRNRILLREEEVNAGDYLMVVKNNYYWLEEDSGMGFIANGDIVEVQSLRNHQELYGFHFADATLRFVDYPDMPLHDCKLLLETLHSESPSLTADQSRQLFEAVMEDYADMPLRADRLRAVKQNPYYNALQVKFSYALTCHKTQGGQWHTAIVDQGYLTDEMIDKEYLRWLYTAVTRATDKVYLLQFQDNFFARPDNNSGD